MPRRAVAALAALVALASACAGATAGRGALPGPWAWASPLHRDHPLVGRVFSVRAGAFVDEAALAADLADADFVLLGGAQDNPDHGLVEAALVRAVAALPRTPALALAALQTDQQRALDAALLGAPPDLDAVAAAIGPGREGAPDPGPYRPLLAAALEARLPLRAADLPRDQVGRFFRSGHGVFAPAVRALLDRAGDPSAPVLRALREEVKAAHCGRLPPRLVDPIAHLLLARDAQLAERLLAADPELTTPGYEQGAILVAEVGHVRRGRGVAAHLAREAPGRAVRTVAVVEVEPGRDAPDAYAGRFGAGPLPFDYVVFTPGIARADPCAGIREPVLPAAPTLVVRR